MPSTYQELTDLFSLLGEIYDVHRQGVRDVWKWKASTDGIFSVSSARKFMSNHIPADSSTKINWKCWVPLKCKILAWRAARNRLPTTSELSKRGVLLQQSDCVLCLSTTETNTHLFTGCLFTSEVWNRVEFWCRLPPSFFFDVQDLFLLAENSSFSKDERHILRGIVYTTLWVLWNERNARIFTNKKRRPIELVEIVKTTSFLWCRNRTRWKNIVWQDWCNYPLVLM